MLPQIANAILAHHNFILLGLRGQAKSRILRGLVNFLDMEIPYVAGCEIHDNPLAPLCRSCRDLIAEKGDATPIAWLPRDARLRRELATLDVTIADILGDVDPIKAARTGLAFLGDELHHPLRTGSPRERQPWHLLVNELPDLRRQDSGRPVQHLPCRKATFRLSGYPVRMPLDVLGWCSPRIPMITPPAARSSLHLRTASARKSARTILPATIEEGIAITEQEAWVQRDGGRAPVEVPGYIREVVEQIAFLARDDKRIDRRSGVSQRLPIACIENMVSSAEQRAVRNHEARSTARVADVYAALPAITGKMELEYEGELRGAENIAREMIRGAVGKVFTKYFETANLQPVVHWFELGGDLKVLLENARPRSINAITEAAFRD